MEALKILVVDDHSLFRQGLTAVLSSECQFKVVGQAETGEQAIRRTEELKPDIILMDIQMPGCGGLEAVRSIRENGFSGGILMLTVSDKSDDLFAAVKSGANGYLVKNVEPDELIQAITHVARGEVMLSPVMATKLLAEFSAITEKAQQAAPPETRLSERERQILQLVANGESNKDIASSLFIAGSTVKTHIRHIMEKLHLKNRNQVTAYASRIAAKDTA